MNLSDKTIACIGLGPMGAALAGVLLTTGARVRVWNRSPEKAGPLVARGAVAGATPGDALDSADVIVVCLANYAAWRAVTDDPAIRHALAGKLLIQLTGGTLPDVEDHVEMVASCGAQLIEGAIFCFPSQIGTQEASILVAGQPHALETGDPYLRALSPRLTVLGENYTAPVVLGRAAISSMLGLLVGTINGAALCQAAGVPIAAYGQQVAENAQRMVPEAARILDAIAHGQTKDTQAALATWADGHKALLDVARRLGTDTVFHDGMHTLFIKARSMGLGDHDLSALIYALSSNEGVD